MNKERGGLNSFFASLRMNAELGLLLRVACKRDVQRNLR